MQASAQLRERHIESVRALHAERGGVDQQADIARAVGAVAPVVGLHARAEMAGDDVGTIARAIEDAHLGSLPPAWPG